MERLSARYLIESPLAPEAAVALLAGGQSSSTFVNVAGETRELKERFTARVEQVTEVGSAAAPSLPAGKPFAGPFRRAEAVISWSIENFGYNLPAIISAVAGGCYEYAQFSGLRLLDIEFPPSFASRFRGPAFGVEGCRRLAGVDGRPLIGTIIKPNTGLAPGQTAALVDALAGAEIDFIKDDELMADPPHSPFDERVDAVMRVVRDHADRTGRKVMYAFNISDESDAMMRHYDKVVAAGGTCALLSINSVGLSAAKKICDRGALAIHGHRNGWGMLTRDPLLGMDFTAYQKLWRLAGVDQIHVNGLSGGFSGKFWEPDDSVVRSIRACGTPLLGGRNVLPVVSAGQWGGQAPETWRRTRTIDLLYMAGGGILGHPEGPAAGVRALRRWWEAAVEGLTVGQAAAKYPELAQSLAKFGKRD